MSNKTEITRTVQIDGKTVHIHIHLSEDEIRRLLLPHVASAFAAELRAHTWQPQLTSGRSTMACNEATMPGRRKE